MLFSGESLAKKSIKKMKNNNGKNILIVILNVGSRATELRILILCFTSGGTEVSICSSLL